MTTKVASFDAPMGARAAFRFVQAADAIRQDANAWRLQRKTVSALNKLSTRELDDLGIVRGDIEAIAARAARR